MRLGVTGHQNIPRAAISYVEREFAPTIIQQGATAGVSSLAKGADQLFAEAILQAGLPLEVVIPCDRYESTLVDPSDRACYRVLLSRAATAETLPFRKPSEEAFYAAGKRIVDISDVLVAVWDGKPAGGLGGTSDIVAYAKRKRRRIVVIWPPGVHR